MLDVKGGNKQLTAYTLLAEAVSCAQHCTSYLQQVTTHA